MTGITSAYLVLLSLFFHGPNSRTISYGQEVQPPWYTALPDCPCIDPDYEGVVLDDGWAKDKGDISKYHKGAVSSYRSYPPVKTNEGKSSQQCCYDENGKLITDKQGAGTPDKVSTCRGEDKSGQMLIRWSGVIGHYIKDVKPWNRYMKADSINGWQEYNKLWTPNEGKDCIN